MKFFLSPKGLMLFLKLLLSSILYSQQYDAYISHNFEELRKKYTKYGENDEAAFKYLQPFIDKAQREKNYYQLSRGYIDAVYFSQNNKITYADSAISAAMLTKKEDFIARSYLAKGSIYYFNYKQYQKALNEYLLAHKYAKKIDDKYLKNRIDYQLAVAKGYLGYNQEAILLLDNCINYFENEFKKKGSHPNVIFNHQKGYLNSIHQSINFHYNLGDNVIVDSLIQVGLNHTPSSQEFILEQSYFYKWRGIQSYNDKNYTDAIYFLKKSLDEVNRVNDFTQASIINFYIGKSLIEQGNKESGYIYLNKIDSIFNENYFILPELRKAYEILINYHKDNNNLEKQLYYTNQLLKADEFFISDFRYLSQKITKEYDTSKLHQEKEILLSKNKVSVNALIISALFIIILSTLLYIQYKRGQIVKNNYINLIKKIEENSIAEFKPENKPFQNSLQGSHLSKEILQKLAFFESKEKFLDSELTQTKLASLLKTNTTYLSQIINEYKGMNFSQYINTLRINYITKLLYRDKGYLNHSIEALAEKSGFSSRQVFSNVFYKVNHMRPKDFILRRKKELEREIPKTVLL